MKSMHNIFYTIVQALKYTILTFATIHLLIVTIFAVIQSTIDPLNLFNITGASLPFPSLGEGVGSFLVGMIIAIAVWAFYFIRLHLSKNSAANDTEPLVK